MRKSTTLKRQSLQLDLMVMTVIAVIIIGSAWIIYSGLKKQFIKNNASDASNATVFIDAELSHAQEQLALFASVPAADRQGLADRRFETFSDLYALDTSGRIKTIYKSSPQTRLFTGYAFTAGPVWRQLLSNSNVARLSTIVAGYEDGSPSVYVAYRDRDGTILGRLNLSYIQSFINQYSRITGNVLLLTTDKGVVMISGRPDMMVPRIDIEAIEQGEGLSYTLSLDDQQWVPIVTDSPALGAQLAVLVPTRLLDNQRNTMLIALVVVLLSLMVIAIIKNRSLNRKVLAPLSTLMARFRSIETGQTLTSPAPIKPGLPTELVEINEHVQAMSEAIIERESRLATTAAELSKRESELSLILQHLPVPLIVFQPSDDQIITFTNASFLDALGYNTSEAHSLKVLFGHTCQDDKTALRVSQAIEDMIAYHQTKQKPAEPLEIRIQCRSGIKHDFIVSAISLQDTAIATLVDVTALRQSQHALIQAKTKAEKQEREQSQFLAMMSHEIRTPLTSILGITELLAQDKLTARQRDLVARLTDVNQLLLRIVNDVLDHSKIEAGELNLQAFGFNLHELLTTCQRMFTQLANDKHIELSFDVQADCPAWRTADAFRLEQVLSNLIGNAIKFTERGSVTVKCACPVSDTKNPLVRIEVTDTGMGIPEALKPLIFEPYKQIEHGSVKKLGGTGLGLAISKRIVDAMGGQIGFATTEKVGTTFWVQVPLPIANPAKEELPDQSKPGIATVAAHLKGARVLVVDDSAAIQFLVTEMLHAADVQCTCANDGLEALNHLKNADHTYDAVLMDIQMPNMGGVQCTGAIRTDTKLKDIPIIAMTADLVGQQREDIINAGADAVLQKPLGQDTLIQCLAQHIEATPQRLFPHVDGIERDHAMHAMGQNAALFRRLLQVFLHENTSTTVDLKQTIDNGYRTQAIDQLRRLSAGASQIGALTIKKIADQMEMLVHANARVDDSLFERIDAELKKIAEFER
jgi:signal transduction histidine kinase/DNA-binding response OmpR family regulator